MAADAVKAALERRWGKRTPAEYGLIFQWALAIPMTDDPDVAALLTDQEFGRIATTVGRPKSDALRYIVGNILHNGRVTCGLSHYHRRSKDAIKKLRRAAADFHDAMQTARPFLDGCIEALDDGLIETVAHIRDQAKRRGGRPSGSPRDVMLLEIMSLYALCLGREPDFDKNGKHSRDVNELARIFDAALLRATGEISAGRPEITRVMARLRPFWLTMRGRRPHKPEWGIM